MSERNAALAEAIATGLEHIAKGLRQWAQAQRALPDRAAGHVVPTGDGGDRLVKVKEAAQILGVSTSTVYKLMNEGAIKKHEHTGYIARSELDRALISRACLLGQQVGFDGCTPVLFHSLYLLKHHTTLCPGAVTWAVPACARASDPSHWRVGIAHVL